MLKGINPLLTPELLKCLAEMGHADTVAIVDAHFTCERYRARTTSGLVVRLPGCSIEDVIVAILSVFPLGAGSERPVRYMQTQEHEGLTPRQQSVLRAAALAPEIHALAVERFAFYELVCNSHVIVQTGSDAPYSNFLLSKGVWCAG